MKHATFILPLALTGGMLLAGCAGMRLNKAEQAYNRMAYDKAAATYARIPVGKMDRNARLHAGETDRLRGNDAGAAFWFASADSLGALSSTEALHYGQVLMRMKKSQEAAHVFARLLADNPEDRAAQDLYASCLSVNSFYKDTARFTLNELVLPGMRNVFSAMPYKNGILVVGEQDAPMANANPWNGMSYLDLYYSEKKTIVTWLDALPVPGKVNGTYHEGPMAISSDGRTMYFTRSHYTERKLAKDGDDVSHLMLFRATLNDEGEWDDIRAFAYNGFDFSTGHPALSADSKTLYFASDRPGGHGGTDLWMSQDNGTGWSEPENLGPTVNTSGNELFPTINGTTLYFASTAHENMGGLDIFSTVLQAERWSEPENLGYPMNTTHDDFGFVMEEGGNSGYLSSDRTGSDRIHAFIMNQRIFMLAGEVADSSGFLPHVEVKLLNVETLEETLAMTDAQGRLHMHLGPESTYDVIVQREGYLAARKRISTKGLATSDTLDVKLDLMGIELNKPIAIQNIYFDYDKWDIRPDAAKELDKLLAVIKENPDLSFELGSHTDARGGDLYNLVLSDARANSTVDYLIRNGADPARIKAKGYGEERLVNTCDNGVKCSEEAHQANRRTEFTITYVNMAGN